jgi:hypothetical protein
MTIHYSSREAQTTANNGQPSVAVWGNSGGIGHVAMIRPGEYSKAKGPIIAQAGGLNINSGAVGQNIFSVWENKQMQSFVYA